MRVKAIVLGELQGNFDKSIHPKAQNKTEKNYYSFQHHLLEVFFPGQVSSMAIELIHQLTSKQSKPWLKH